MKQLLQQIKKYLEDRSDADWDGEKVIPNDAMTIENIISWYEHGHTEEDYMWHEILEYCEDKGLTEWAQQIENYFINTSIG